MEPFKYEDYLYYKKIYYQKNNLYKLNDTDEKYNYENKEINQPHDKLFKEVLDNKKEAANLINQALNLKNIKYKLTKDDIEKYNRKFITNNFSNTESDIIYKKKNQNIFFLIEHQSTIDYSMPYRIMKYNMCIMESAIDKNKVKNKNYKLPVIFSFVIYTGNKKWDANNYLEEKQEKLNGCTPRAFANFQVIDVNDYTKEELLENENLLSKLMLLEKAKDINELESYLQDIIEKPMEDEPKEFLMRVINYILEDKISEEKLKQFTVKLEKKKKGENIMFVEIINNWVDEMLAKEATLAQKEENIAQKEENIAQKEENIAQKEENVIRREEEFIQKQKELNEKERVLEKNKNRIVVEMLKNNVEEKIIMKILKIDKSELDKIKKENRYSA